MKFLLLILAGFLIGCDNNRDPKLGGFHLPYVVDMHQGNIIGDSSITKLQIGMSKEQVKAVLGEPLLIDTFRPNRWDYVQIDQIGTRKPKKKSVTLFFNDAGLIAIRR